MSGFFLFLVREMLVGLEASGADEDAASSRKCSPLKVRFSKSLADGVKFGSTNTVGISSTHNRFFITNWTSFGHKLNFQILILNFHLILNI